MKLRLITITTRIAAATVLILLSGCGSNSSDSWYNQGSVTYSEFLSNAIPTERLIEVDEAYRQLAEAKLTQSPMVKITPDEAQLYARKATAKQTNVHPYLVRGLFYEEGTGSFKAYYSNGKLFIHHASLASARAKQKRRELIIWLEAQPTNVFVTCSKGS